MKAWMNGIRTEIACRKALCGWEGQPPEMGEDGEKWTEEERNERMERLCAYIRAHDQRMEDDPEYARQWRRRMRSLDVYLFFHDSWSRRRALTAPFRALQRWLNGGEKRK